MSEGEEGQALVSRVKNKLPTNLTVSKLLTLGRPTKLNKEIALEVVKEIINGASMPAAAKAVGVDYTTLWYWSQHSVSFSHMLQEAREARAHFHVEDSLSRLENNSNDLYDNGKVIAVNNAQVQRDYRLAEFRYKLAGKFNALYRDDTNANQVNLQLNLTQAIDLPPEAKSREEWEANRKQQIELLKIENKK